MLRGLAERYFASQARKIEFADVDGLATLRAQASRWRRRFAGLEADAQARLSPVPVIETSSGALHHRPAPFCQALPDFPVGAIENGTALHDGVSLYHDCPNGEIAIRQVNRRPNGIASSHSLCLETYHTEGAFMSLAIALPDELARDVSLNSLVSLDFVWETEVPTAIHSRLNLRYGPNTEKITHEVDTESRSASVVFDVFFTEFDALRRGDIWIDLSFAPVPMNAICIHDIRVGVQRRANL